MIKTYTCIICPQGCELEVKYDRIKEKILSVVGAKCPRGNKYIEQEFTNPQRTIQTSIAVENGELPLVSVKLSGSIPKNKIFKVMEAINEEKLIAPVQIGQIIIENVLGLNVNVVSTKNVREYNCN